MSIKSLGQMASARFGRHMLAVQKSSPTILVGIGIVGMTATAVLASRATMKLSDVLKEGETLLEKADEADDISIQETEKVKFGVKLTLAIKIAKLYAPAIIVGGISICAMTGSYRILQKRNAGLAAAYSVVNKQLRDYRGRVVADVGKDKDYEYLHGVEEREVIVEGKNGELKTEMIRGLDQEKMLLESPEENYRRVFKGPDKDGLGGNPNWNPAGNQNQVFLGFIQSQLNDLLRMQGHVFLNQALDLLGFEPTESGQIVGWVKNPRKDPVTGEPTGDTYIDFGLWNNGVYEGTQWLNGDKEAVMLEFNVDGPILYALATKG